jgi:hypothetical protein
MNVLCMHTYAAGRVYAMYAHLHKKACICYVSALAPKGVYMLCMHTCTKGRVYAMYAHLQKKGRVYAMYAHLHQRACICYVCTLAKKGVCVCVCVCARHVHVPDAHENKCFFCTKDTVAWMSSLMRQESCGGRNSLSLCVCVCVVRGIHNPLKNKNQRGIFDAAFFRLSARPCKPIIIRAYIYAHGLPA